ncbi:MAG: DUF1667 domain-containing protein [Acholeplasmatales bacterium]|jgi:CxxC motif-containing protein|nr:DUF1667 domain-containing protein [Acholeplasmataceae bacterium]MCK9289690.1 DUF1667 domain-containing protein [Acholeplasmataceae bacterium]MCK9428319.1 DUF1667 domain-containing protein [Acholeplasmataceae bacterium]MDY0115511.1 DUF1667 domain-containing protein [Acholeplasmatales bacterium]HHT39515.1 DUF1667 domain-containing protein [Acholeplasmataceae bacterium]
MEKTLICIRCPIGCTLTYKDGIITGNKCKRGIEYGLEEVTNPKRIITSTVKTTNKEMPRLSVKTNISIPKGLMFKIMKEINKVIVSSSKEIGDVIISNILNTGANLIATQNLSY